MFKPKNESEHFFRRAKRGVFVFTLIVVAGFATVTLRLWHLQVIQHDHLSDRAENNRVREVTLDGLRGKILDRSGVPLVDNRPSFELSLIPEDVPKPKEALAHINRHIPLDGEALLADIRQGRSFAPVTLKRDIDRQAVAFIEESRYDLPGVFLAVKPIRRYIYGPLAAHLFGHLGTISESQLDAASAGVYSPNDFVGQYGVEKRFEERLRGEKGLKRVEVDAAGRTLATLGANPAKSGDDLTLTIDFHTQQAAETAFTHADTMGAAVAVDPRNGDVLAYVSRPTFDPNHFAYGVSRTDWSALVNHPFNPLTNRPLQGQYPPGSTFKPFVALAALAEGTIDPEKKVVCNGSFRFGNRSYRCWKKGGHGAVDMHEAIVQSCDVYFYTLGVKMGIDTLAANVKKFGLGAPTGFPLDNEKGGLIPTTEWKQRTRHEAWIGGETVSCAIGQGFVLVTPVQMAVATAAIANGGTVLTPRIVADGRPIEPVRRIDIKPEYMEIVRAAMRGVVYEPHGTAWRLKLAKRPYEYAGKTGTAQVIRMKQNEEWVHEDMAIRYRDHAWFIAWAPYDDPKIAVAVLAEHAGHGGDAAAPIAQNIIDAYLSRLDREEKPSTAARPGPTVTAMVAEEAR